MRNGHETVECIFSFLTLHHLFASNTCVNTGQNRTSHTLRQESDDHSLREVFARYELFCILLNIFLQSISNKTTATFILTNLALAIGKMPMSLSLQQISIDNALKHPVRGCSHSNSFENNIETVTISPSHAVKNFSPQSVASVTESTKKDISIRPAIYITSDATTKLIAAEERWYHAADFGFNNPFVHKVDSRRFWIWSVIRPDNNQLHKTFT